MTIRSAFTLIEILIVVVILGILASVVVPQFASATQDASQVATLDQLTKVRRAVQVYFYDHSSYPQIVAGDGTWGQLMDRTHSVFLREKPRNFWVGGVNQTVISLGVSANSSYQSSYGWIFNPANGEVWAAAFDQADNAFPHP
jgi:prepilin-type N-terminal cleavage/methylation domain-containing protein